MNYSSYNNQKRRKRRASKSTKIKHKTSFVIFRVIVAGILISAFALGGAFVGAYLGIIDKAPSLADVMKTSNENYTSIIYDEKGNELDRLVGGENRVFVSIDNIPKYLQDAFVAIEDERFYTHDGVDVKAMLRSIYVTITGDTQGGSTLTQQLIKNKLGLMRNSFVTKFQEQHLAVEYEKNMVSTYGSKEDAKKKILELYLNSIGLGYGQVGVQAASLRYFNKEVSELTLAECSVIAGITQNPTYRDPIRKQENNNKRRLDILNKMLELGFINDEEYETAIDEDVYSKINETQEERAEQSSVHSYFVDRLVDEVRDALKLQYGYNDAEAYDIIYNGGIKIYATVDTRIQKIVDEAFLNESIFPDEFGIEVQYVLSVKNLTTGKLTHYPTEKDLVKTDAEADAFIETIRDRCLGADDVIDGEQIFKIPQPQAGMCIIDYHSGKVVAIAGGRGEKQANKVFNRATDAVRQPGSVFKVLASYAPALDMNLITATTVLEDAPFTVADYSPSNWYSGYRGSATVRVGIRDSMNILAVKNMYNTGVDNCFNYLMQFGFTTLSPENDKYLPTALGGITNGVTQLETAAAFGAIANNGVYYKPYFFTKVIDNEDNLLLETVPEGVQVLKRSTAYVLTDMMKDVITSGTGTSAKFKSIEMPISGKTGTTSDDKDLFFSAFTPYYSASIYLGYDTPKSMSGNTSSVHMKIWNYIMEQVHASLENRDFEVPDDVVVVDLCTSSGKLATSSCISSERSRREVFAIGTQPTGYCNYHKYTAPDPVEVEAPPDTAPDSPPDTATEIEQPQHEPEAAATFPPFEL